MLRMRPTVVFLALLFLAAPALAQERELLPQPIFISSFGPFRNAATNQATIELKRTSIDVTRNETGANSILEVEVTIERTASPSGHISTPFGSIFLGADRYNVQVSLALRTKPGAFLAKVAQSAQTTVLQGSAHIVIEGKSASYRDSGSTDAANEEAVRQLVIRLVPELLQRTRQGVGSPSAGASIGRRSFRYLPDDRA